MTDRRIYALRILEMDAQEKTVLFRDYAEEFRQRGWYRLAERAEEDRMRSAALQHQTRMKIIRLTREAESREVTA